MENKINIAELLKDCPKGMELYSPIFGKVYLDKIRPHLAIVVTTDDELRAEFLYDGRYGMNGECMLFPSKGKTTWKGFQRPFVEGDIVFYNNTIAIFKEWGDETLFRSYVIKYLYKDCDTIMRDVPLFGKGVRKEIRFATEEEKQKLFDIIKANGYKWNAETKTLEKLPMFEVGDKIKKKGDTRLISIKDVRDNYYIITIPDYFDNRYITDKLLFSNQDEYELVTNKFDITTLKAYDKVLVRHNKDNKWCCAFFSHIDKDLHSHCYKFVTTGGKSYPYCIPYEDNQELRGTTNDCDNYFKTWQK